MDNLDGTEVDESQLAVQAVRDPEPFTVLYNRYFERIYNFFRRHKRAIFVNLDTVLEMGATTSDLADTVIEQETRMELLTAIRSLFEREQDVLGLKYWAG